MDIIHKNTPLRYQREYFLLWTQIPLVLLAIGLSILAIDNIFFNRIFPILLVIIFICQLIYNYIKWKSHSSKEQMTSITIKYLANVEKNLVFIARIDKKRYSICSIILSKAREYDF